MYIMDVSSDGFWILGVKKPRDQSTTWPVIRIFYLFGVFEINSDFETLAWDAFRGPDLSFLSTITLLVFEEELFRF